jgi:hypothetical protein
MSALLHRELGPNLPGRVSTDSRLKKDNMEKVQAVQSSAGGYMYGPFPIRKALE